MMVQMNVLPSTKGNDLNPMIAYLATVLRRQVA
jgi:hypothetical protein